MSPVSMTPFAAMRSAFKAGLAVAVMLLAGCAGNSVTPTHYVLPPDDGSTAPAPVTDGTLLIDQPQLATHLGKEGIILQLDEITLNEATTNLWAAPLGQQLERGIRDRLAHRLPGSQVLLSEGNSRRDALTLELSVDQFQGRNDGTAITSGQWLLRGDDGSVKRYAAFEEIVSLDADGYPALVRALGRSWDRVADDIAEGFRSVAP